jgi:sugar lactone lactonase YvrE
MTPKFCEQLKSRLRLTALPAIGLAVGLGLAACAHNNAPAKRVTYVWPDPPEQARLTFVASFSQASELGFKGSALGRFANWLIGTQRGTEKFIKPFGIGLDEQDNLLVTDTGANTVSFFDLPHKTSRRWAGAGKVRFNSPVAVAKRAETIFVADSALSAVIVFNTEGSLLFQITNGLIRPAGLALGPDRLYVADSQLNQVLVYDLHGRPLTHFGKRGAGPGEFNFPTHLAIDPHGYLLVTDSMNGRVQVLDLDGNFKGQVGTPGDSSGHFGRPKGVAVDSFGRVYVMDALFDNLQIFQRDGRFLLSIGETGSSPGEFWLPNGIAISHDNRIFIADSYNLRVQILKYIGPS